MYEPLWAMTTDPIMSPSWIHSPSPSSGRWSHMPQSSEDPNTSRKDVGCSGSSGKGVNECSSAQVGLTMVTLAKWVPVWEPVMHVDHLYLHPCLVPTPPVHRIYLSYVGLSLSFPAKNNSCKDLVVTHWLGRWGEERCLPRVYDSLVVPTHRRVMASFQRQKSEEASSSRGKV